MSTGVLTLSPKTATFFPVKRSHHVHMNADVVSNCEVLQVREMAAANSYHSCGHVSVPDGLELMWCAQFYSQGCSLLA
jgi:hypothetical protein